MHTEDTDETCAREKEDGCGGGKAGGGSRSGGGAGLHVVERGFVLERLLSGMSGRGEFPIKFNGNLFTTEKPPFDAGTVSVSRTTVCVFVLPYI